MQGRGPSRRSCCNAVASSSGRRQISISCSFLRACQREDLDWYLGFRYAHASREINCKSWGLRHPKKLDYKRALTGCSRGSKRSSWGAPGFLKLPESLKTESEAAFTAAWSTLEAGSCAVPAFSSRRRSAEYSPALEKCCSSVTRKVQHQVTSTVLGQRCVRDTQSSLGGVMRACRLQPHAGLTWRRDLGGC